MTALDSFNEALAKYREGQAGDIKAYKFAILHFSHFLELQFKFYVSQAHPLLIYKNPFSNNIAREQTIGLWEAVQFLKNEGNPLDVEFTKDLEWLKLLRNRIEHHAFEMDVASVRRTLGRLIRAMNEFNANVANAEIENLIADTNLAAFQELADEYKAELAHAQSEAKELAGADSVHNCGFCGASGTSIFSEGIYICQYCKEADNLINCCVCGADDRRSNATLWNEDQGGADYACEACIVRIGDMI